ncbi:MAG: biotin-dependent carboxyltransferase family protein [Clostridium sp.]
MGIKFANGGFLTTIQDAGRTGFQESGVPVTGVMDTRSYHLANILVGNQENEAVLEVTLMGPMFEFTSDNIVAVTGADLGAKINGKDIPMYEAVKAKKGDSMSFMGIKSGSRAYVAFAGGLDIPLVMGSRSTHLKSKLGGLDGRKIGAGDEIEFLAPKTELPNFSARKTAAEDFKFTECTLRVVMGPQDDCFTEQGIATFLGHDYALTNEADRMGLRFEGELIEHKNGGDIITDGISFGAVQIPSHGQPIVMMADHQTTGGYTKIASVISVDLPKAAQMKPGCKVRFKQISIEEAQDLYVKELESMQALREKLDKIEVKVPAKEKEAVAMAVATAAATEGRYMVKKKYKVVIDGEEFEVELESQVQGLR